MGSFLSSGELRAAIIFGNGGREAERARKSLVIQAGYHSASKFFLGECYLNGWGFEVDYFEAYRLLKGSSNRKEKEENYEEAMALLFGALICSKMFPSSLLGRLTVCLGFREGFERVEECVGYASVVAEAVVWFAGGGSGGWRGRGSHGSRRTLS